jgi:hypothetical protein
MHKRTLDLRRSKRGLENVLGMDKEVIERAKAANIYISAIIDETLKSATYDKQDKTDEVLNAYDELFRSMIPLIKKDDLYIAVGGYKESDIDGYKLCLYPASQEFEVVTLIYVLNNTDGFDGHYNICTVNDVVGNLYTPKTILQNLILEIVGNVENNEQQKVRELKLAKHFVEELSSEIEYQRISSITNGTPGDRAK